MDALIAVLRTVLLLALAGWLGYAVVNGVVLRNQEAHQAARLKATSTLQADPGIRVLLHQRGTGGATREWHESGDITVLVECVLDLGQGSDGAAQQVRLSAGEVLRIQPAADRAALLRLRSDVAGTLRLGDRSSIRPAALSPAPDAGIEGSSDLAQREESDGRPVFALGTRRYRGSLELRFIAPTATDPGRLHLINALPMEAYVLGTLHGEVSARFPIEALKAQAVAIRSYAYVERLQRDENSSFDLHDVPSRSQEYAGVAADVPAMRQAVLQTRGQVLFHNESPFKAYFHASSGGQTAMVDDGFVRRSGGRVIPERNADGSATVAAVMPSVEDPFCYEGCKALGWLDSRWEHRVLIDPQRLGQALAKLPQAGASGGKPVIAIEPECVGDTRKERRRVVGVTLKTLVGQVTVSYEAFKDLLRGSQGIPRSNLWKGDSPERTDGGWLITSYGLGHGVGLSQVSAYAMASLHDWRHEDILAFFYPGAALRVVW